LGNQVLEVKSAFYNSSINIIGDKIQSNQFTAFATLDYVISSKLKVSAGFHNLLFNTTKYTKNYFQPRALMQYKLSPNSSTSLSYCKNTQALHLLANNGVGMPTDIWVPADAYAKPEQAQQLNLNYTRYFFKRKYSLQADMYYKQMTSLIRYKEGFNLFSPKNDWNNSIYTNGKGTSYGLEVLAKKETGKLTGFVAYTLSKTTNQFEGLNNNKPFYFKYDRRHELNVFGNFAVNKNINLNANFYFATGNAITLPKGIYNVPMLTAGAVTNFGGLDYGLYNNSTNEPNYAFYYDGINKQRTSSFHRLDIAATFSKQKKHGLRTWTVGIYNTYNHHNPFAYQYVYSYKQQELVLKSVSVFQIMPFFSYDYKF